MIACSPTPLDAIRCAAPAHCERDHYDATEWLPCLPWDDYAPKDERCSSPLDECRPPTPTIARPWRPVPVWRCRREPVDDEPIEAVIARCQVNCEAMVGRVVRQDPRRPAYPVEPLPPKFSGW